MRPITTFQFLANAVADIIWPPYCHACGGRPDSELRWLCRHCLERLPRTHFRDDEMNPATITLAGKFPFKRASAYLFYNPRGMLGPIFHDFKYHGFPSLARYMGQLAANDMEMRPFFNGVDYLIPVPMYPLKQIRRGYNQTEEIALGLSSVLKVPLGAGFKAIRSHRTQTKLSSEQRETNIEGIFRYRPPHLQRGKTICLIDDVLTTGATITSAAKALLTADPTMTLYVFALALTR